MLSLTVSDKELRFEHSLVSLSEWEAEHQFAFYSETHEKTAEQMLRYFECMYVGKSKHEHLVRLMDDEQTLELVEYINDARSATIINNLMKKNTGMKETITSELIYFWLVSFEIPFKPTDEWHLNRLIKLVEICGVKNQTPEKRKPGEMAKDYRQINEERRKLYGTKG